MPTDPRGFNEHPFADVHDPRFLYRGRSHCEAVAYLRRAIESREPFALLTGLPGVGKTTALEAAFTATGPHTRVTIPASPALGREKFLECLFAGLAPGATGDAAPADEGLEARLRAAAAEGRPAVLVVEEAQDLAPSLLGDLALYSNLEAEGRVLLQIVLVGRPALEETLAEPAAEPLRRRIGPVCRLEPLGAGETEGYVRHRVAIAGGDELSRFSSDACQTLHRLTHGIPREIHRLAGEALALADTAGEDRVVAGHVAGAVVMLGFRSAAGDAPVAASAPAPVAEPAAAMPGADAPADAAAEASGPIEPPVTPWDEPLAGSREREPARPEEPATVEVDIAPEPPMEPAEETVLAVAEVDVTPRSAGGAPRWPGRRGEAPRESRTPRTPRHRRRTTAWAAVALLLVVAGGFALTNAGRDDAGPQTAARPAVVTPAAEPADARTASLPPTALPRVTRAAVSTPAPVPAVASRPTPIAAPAAVKSAAPVPSFAVEVATFLSESRARAERDRLAGLVQLPCQVVPDGEDGYAVVVGPVAGSKEATRLSVDLSHRGLVGEARVVRWAAGGSGR